MKEPQLMPTDIPNPIDGGVLYVWARRQSKCRRLWRKLSLTWCIWWNGYESPIDLRTAWEVAGIVHDRKWVPCDPPEGATK